MRNKIINASAKAPLLGITAVLAVTVLTFQNCSKVHFAANQVSNAEFSSSSQMTINNGAKYTNVTGVKVQFVVPTADDVYLTNDSTCTTGGAWQQLVPELPWNLSETNSTATVYAKFKATGGAELPCISASIINDNQPPAVSFVTFPVGFSKNAIENLVVSGTDAVSGIDHFECRGTGQTSFVACSTTPEATSSTDGSYSFQVRAVDRAGNTSIAVEKDWVFDRTAPVVTIVSTPSNPSQAAVAQFTITATDGVGGSGVDHMVCSLDRAPGATCGTTVTFSNPLLMNGTHAFAVYAVDKAGNQSTPKTYAWDVQVTTAGAFQILGVTGLDGTADAIVDMYLAGSLVPVIHWSESIGSAYYNVSIFPHGSNTAKCAATNVPDSAAPSFAFSASNCALVDGNIYDVSVIAYTVNNTPTAAGPFTFLVDASGPMITFGAPVISTDQKTVDVSFAVADSGSGVQGATCTIYNQKDKSSQTFDCTGATTHEFTNLVDGVHSFSIAAVDKAGNVSNKSESITTLLIVCDPLNGVSVSCSQGLKGDLYYMTNAQRAGYDSQNQSSTYQHVDGYISYGTKAASLIYMSQVFIPTRSFESGFNAADGSYVTDNNGTKLVEWFALDLQSFYKLGHDSTGKSSESAGTYQFALISDDGAVMQVKDSNGNWVDYLNNDGYNSSHMKCDTVGMQLTTSSAVNMRLKYFQGPANQIALTMLVRKIATPNSTSFADPDCDKGGNAYFWGSNYDDYSMSSHYAQLLSRGWYVPDSSHFEITK